MSRCGYALMLALFGLMVGCPSTPKPKPTPKPPVLMGQQAQRLVTNASLSLPKSAHSVVALDLVGLRRDVIRRSRGLAGKRSRDGQDLLDDWSGVLTKRFGISLKSASLAVWVWFGKQHQMLYVKGPINLSSVPVQNTLIRGKSVLKHTIGPRTWFMAQADGGYVLFFNRGAVDAWVGRQAMGKSDWVRFQSHPQSLIHFAFSKETPLYNLLGSKAPSLKAESVHGWVDARDIHVRIDAAEGTRAAWRVVMEQLSRKSRKLAGQMRQESKKLTAPRALSELTSAHVVERAGELATFKERGQQLHVTIPNVLVEDTVLMGAVLGFMFEQTIQNAKYDGVADLAQLQLKRLQNKVATSIRNNNCTMPEQTTVTPPLTNACSCDASTRRPGQRCIKDTSTLWAQKGWQAISFAPKRTGPFAYQLVRDGDRIQIVLRSDLDCDAVYTTFRASVRPVKTEDGTCSVKLGAVFSRNVRD